MVVRCAVVRHFQPRFIISECRTHYRASSVYQSLAATETKIHTNQRCLSGGLRDIREKIFHGIQAVLTIILGLSIIFSETHFVMNCNVVI